MCSLNPFIMYKVVKTKQKPKRRYIKLFIRTVLVHRIDHAPPSLPFPAITLHHTPLAQNVRFIILASLLTCHSLSHPISCVPIIVAHRAVPIVFFYIFHICRVPSVFCVSTFLTHLNLESTKWSGYMQCEGESKWVCVVNGVLLKRTQSACTIFLFCFK